LLLGHKMYDKVIETLKTAIIEAEKDNDFVSFIRANCFLGEALFMQNDYEKAKEYLSFVCENSHKIEDYDDLLDTELSQCNLLWSLIERYGILDE